jgi:toxin ParE1/3/4
LRRLDYLPQAEHDLDDIKRYIARDNPRRALSFIRELRQSCERLAENPLIGRARPELRARLRSLPHGSYIIFYHAESDGVTIARILHGSRDITKLF